MRPWKAVLGVGAACAACCAVPLVGGVASLTVGASALAATTSALLACADEFAPLAAGLLALAVVVGAAVWWLRCVQRVRASAQERPGSPAQCQLEQASPSVSGPTPIKACGCKPGACG
jgi:hypothetical protein